jgi:hypothetical protein
MGSVVKCLAIHGKNVKAYLPRIKAIADKMVADGKDPGEAWTRAVESQVKLLTSELEKTKKRVISEYEKENGKIAITPTVDGDAHEAATSPHNPLPEPTPDQKEAGNYKLGKTEVNGLGIHIENPEGSIRKSHPEAEKQWQTKMKDHYGYFDATAEAPDKDKVDTFVKPRTPKDFKGDLFIVDQKDPKTGKFDEPKVMTGYAGEADAREGYLRNYEKGWDGVMNITRVSQERFKEMLKEKNAFKKAQPVDSAKASLKDLAADENGNPIRALNDLGYVKKVVMDAFKNPVGMENKVGFARNLEDPELPATVREKFSSANGRTQAVYDSERQKVWLLTDNIPKGKELSVALHEIGVHAGMQKMLGQEHYNSLISTIQHWAKSDMGREGEIARAALARVEAAERMTGRKYNTVTRNEEHLAYFVEEAVNRGIDPMATEKSMLGNWFHRLWSAIKAHIEKLGVDPEKLKARDIVDLAYGAARLELNGTWHGTAADFVDFDHRFLKTGEGAMAWGHGSYLAQNKKIAHGYWTADTARKGTKLMGRGEFDPDKIPEGNMMRVDVNAGNHELLAADEPVTEQHEDVLRKFADLLNPLKKHEGEYLASDVLDPETAEVFHKIGDKITPDVIANALHAAKAKGMDYVKVSKTGDAKDSKTVQLADYPQTTQIALSGALYDGSRLYDALAYDEYMKHRDQYNANEDHITRDNYGRVNGLKDSGWEAAHKLASEKLSSMGIKGMKFKDQPSRSIRTPEEAAKLIDDYHKHVGRIEAKIKALEQRQDDYINNGEPGKASSLSTDIDWLREDINNARANMGMLIKELRNPKTPTRNLVMFNDKDIKRVYSEPGARLDKRRFSIAENHERDEKTAEKVAGKVGSKLVKDASTVMQKAADHVKFLHSIVKEVKDKLPAAQEWYQHLLASRETRNEIAKRAETIAGVASTLTTDQYNRVNKFIQDSTESQKWGYTPKWKTGKTPVVVDTDMATRWKALSAKEKGIVDAVFAHGDYIRKTKDELFSKLGLKDIFTDGSRLDGPYAPLRRPGNYMATLKSSELVKAEKKATGDDATAADKAAYDKLKSDPNHYVTSNFDTAGQAMEFAQKNDKANGGKWDWTDHSARPADVASKHTITHQALAKVMSAVKMDASMPAQVRKQMEEMVKDIYATTMSQRDARQAGMRRKNRAGANEDMLRSFLSDARAQAAFVSHIKHGSDINSAFYKLQQQAKNEEGKRVNQDKVNLINEHYANILAPKDRSLLGKADDAAVAATTAVQLSTSLGYHLNNALQGVMFTVPHLAATFSDYPGAWKHFANGYAQMAKITSSWGRETDLSKVKNPLIKDMLEHASKQGILDVGMEENLGHFDRTRTGYGVVDAASKVTHAALHKLRIVASSVERWNRVSAGTAAYTMAKEKGWSHEKARDYAMDVIRNTQGDFTSDDAPLVIKKLPRTVTQYRKFQIMSAGYYAKAASDAFAGASKEERAIGMRMLAFKLFHTSIAAGVMGWPLMNAAQFIYNHNPFGDDEDPTTFEDWMRDAIGDKDTSDLLLHGVGPFIGFDSSAKLGDENAFSILPYTDIDLTSKKGAAETIAGAMGPAFAQVERVAEGVGLLQSGDTMKGIEKFAPKGLESAMKAFRYANEGYTLKNGDVLVNPEDISDFAITMQALSMPSSQMNDIINRENMIQQVTRFFSDKSKNITHRYIEAYRAGDNEAMNELRGQWMDLQARKADQRAHYNVDIPAFKAQPLEALEKAPVLAETRQGKEQAALPQ